MIGDVKPDGVELNLIHGTGGDWPALRCHPAAASDDPYVPPT
jgi:hypothetical protein